MRTLEDDEYNPEYSTLVVRDAWAPTRQPPDPTTEPPLPRPLPDPARGLGTIACAGRGWLHGFSRDGHHFVRLEVHSAAPPDDRKDWHDVVETPFRTATGFVGLTLLTGGQPKEKLQLGEHGLYRVRVVPPTAPQFPVGKRPAPPPRPSSSQATEAVILEFSNGPRSGRPLPTRSELPIGAPPRTGYVSPTGTVVLWRNRAPVTLAKKVVAMPRRAWQMEPGVLVEGADGLVLVGPDGQLRTLSAHAFSLAPSDDGRLLALVESHLGRQESHRLSLIDLASGARQLMPWDESQLLSARAVRRGAVLFGTRDRAFRWTPGSAPVLDHGPSAPPEPLSGRTLTHDSRGAALVHDPNGALLHRLELTAPLTLAPGGTAVYAFRFSPSALTLFDLATGPTKPRIYWLPEDVDGTASESSVWEDRNHLLLRRRGGAMPGEAAALRIDVRDGKMEAVMLGDDAGYNPILIRPLLR